MFLLLDFCAGTHVSNTSEIEELKLIKYEKKGSGIFRIEAISGKENIIEVFNKINKNVEKEILEPFINKINSFNLKLKELNINSLIDIIPILNSLDLKDSNYKIRVNDIKEIISKEIKETTTLMEKEIVSLIKNEFENNNIFIRKFKEINVQEINRQLLNVIDETNGDIAFVFIDNGNKLTLGVVIPKKNLNDDLIQKIKQFAELYGLKGNGKKQQYIFGGRVNDLDKMIKEVKEWEF